jgi:signal transduction histidine kinase
VETTVAIANQAAVAIDNARLFGDARRRATLCHAPFRLADALTAGIESEQTLREMIQLAVETVDADGGSISLLTTPVEAPTSWRRQARRRRTDSASRELRYAWRKQVGLLRLWRQSPPMDEDQDELMASFAGHVRAVLEHHTSTPASRLNGSGSSRRSAPSPISSPWCRTSARPLALIKASVATLLRPSLGLSPEMQSRFLEDRQRADRLRRLIDNLLSVSAVEASVFLHQPQPIDVEPLLRTPWRRPA